MKPFAEQMREARRLAILRLLDEAPGYQLGETLLYESIPTKGISGSAAQVAADVAWLGDVGLVDRTELQGAVFAKLTAAGADCVKGLNNVPGVARPGP